MEKVRPSRPCPMNENSILTGAQKVQNFTLPLSESQIIQLHSMFMTPAQHVIQTKDIMSGRKLLDTMLGSLSYYTQIGCLTTSLHSNPVNIIDVYSILQKHAQVYGLGHAIEEFFVSYHNIDFIWIELTNSLLAQMGKPYIQHMCQILTAHQTMPVVVVQYEQNEL